MHGGTAARPVGGRRPLSSVRGPPGTLVTRPRWRANARGAMKRPAASGWVTATLAFAFLLLSSLAGCKSRGGTSHKTTIAVIPKGAVHTFWRTVGAGAEQAAKDEQVEIIWTAPHLETDYN